MLPRYITFTTVLLCTFAYSPTVASGEPAQGQSHPRIWQVANNGVDRTTCGTRDAPCRSISEALAHASRGDIILVGPGIYGDLNQDGVLGGIGEEGVCGFAVVCVRKSVRLLSHGGAERTVIDATGVTLQTNGIAIEAEDVVLGAPGRGFTVRGATNVGVIVQRARARVIDNIALNNRAQGFGLLGTNSIGCDVVGNTALGNAGGGFEVHGRNNRLEFNLAQSNLSSGFVASGENHLLRYNTAIANGQGGIVISDRGSNHRIVLNAVIGNGSNGVNVLQQVTGVVIRKNNIFGNGDSILGSPNRGLINASGSFVLATDNFWGSDTGPGPDPADEIFTNRLSETRFVPFASKPFTIPAERH